MNSTIQLREDQAVYVQQRRQLRRAKGGLQVVGRRKTREDDKRRGDGHAAEEQAIATPGPCRSRDAGVAPRRHPTLTLTQASWP